MSVVRPLAIVGSLLVAAILACQNDQSLVAPTLSPTTVAQSLNNQNGQSSRASPLHPSRRSPNLSDVNNCYTAERRGKGQELSEARVRPKKMTNNAPTDSGLKGAEGNVEPVRRFFYIRRNSVTHANQYSANCVIENTEGAYAAAVDQFSIEGYKGPRRRKDSEAPATLSSSDNLSPDTDPEVDQTPEGNELEPEVPFMLVNTGMPALPSAPLPPLGGDEECYGAWGDEVVWCFGYQCVLQPFGDELGYACLQDECMAVYTTQYFEVQVDGVVAYWGFDIWLPCEGSKSM